MASVRPQVTSRSAAPRAKALRGGEPSERPSLSNLLAHDLKSPLAAISMNLDFALAELSEPADGPVRAALEDCKEANARAVRIVSDMADALRLECGDRRPALRHVSASRVIESVVASAKANASARGVRVVWASNDDLVVADAKLLESALDRLVDRAIRHAVGRCVIDQQGGSIVIRAEIADATEPIRPTAGSGDAAGCALSLFFAEAAIRAQGGGFGIETPAGAVVYWVKLPKVERSREGEVTR